VDSLVETLSGVVAFDQESTARLKGSDDDLDAVISALVAQAAYHGKHTPIPEDALEEARAEGWIRLPAEPSLASAVGV